MDHSEEISAGRRFEFGANWRQFLTTLNDERIGEAEKSLREMLRVESLHGRKFLDAGSGSGLFSLAARRLGATVHSFDFDPQSVACTQELKQRYFADDVNWQIEEASVLDRDFVASLGSFDVVYSWGVLHHTGDMITALENIALPLNSGSSLFIAIYNDQGLQSKLWRIVKRIYCSGTPGRVAMKTMFVPYFALRAVAVGLLRHRHPLGYFRTYKRQRGMSVYFDWIDWLGGYPFEVASVEKIQKFSESRGCELKKLVATKRLGCNQFVFVKK